MFKRLLLLVALSPAAVPADVLQMPGEVEVPDGIHRPAHGMTMKQVRRWFGPPQTQLPAVGDPPITRWIYPKFTVYFEYDRVITSVENRTSAGGG